MKPKPQDHTVTTREDGGATTEVDRRFSLFYENAHNGNNGLYSTIGDSNNTWIYENDKNKTDILHLPAENTVFINANIALTDGNSKKFNTGNKTPRTIPNLYDALTALAAKISAINAQIEEGCSTADKYIYATKENNTVTIAPGNGSTGTFASNVDSESNIHITNGNNSTSITITDKDIAFTIKPNANTDSHTYTLGAIIEAIQELNRRTAFIDSTMTFSEAKNHFDVNNETIDGAVYQGVDDELPAATDNHQGNLGPSNLRSIPSGKLSKMNIIAYDSGTEDNMGKNIPFIQDTSTLNDSTILDDPTVISPESVSVRMRGCPYLLE